MIEGMGFLRARGRDYAWRLALIVLAASMALWVHEAASVAKTKRTGYCAYQNAVFRDRHANVGITDPVVEDGYYPPVGLTARSYRDCSFGLMAANHIGVFRAGIAWAFVEPFPGQYHW